MIVVLGAGAIVFLVVLAGSLLALRCGQTRSYSLLLLSCFGGAISFATTLEIAAVACASRFRYLCAVILLGDDVLVEEVGWVLVVWGALL